MWLIVQKLINGKTNYYGPFKSAQDAARFASEKMSKPLGAMTTIEPMIEPK